MATSPQVIGEDKPLTWEEFEAEVGKLRAELAAEKERSDSYRFFEGWLFRGQQDATWSLKTSLERHLEKRGKKAISDISLVEYFAKMASVVPAINSLAEKNFDRDVAPQDDSISAWNVRSLELVYYLRQHGFPTPTLDWSRSYLVAAFFAFQNAAHGTPVAIYAYNEDMPGLRDIIPNKPFIRALGPYVQTHRRHFLQQSDYTYSSLEGKDGTYFARHDDALFGNPEAHPCRKFILYGSERQKVLERLDEANINAYTLYGTEEGLMEMLAFRELQF